MKDCIDEVGTFLTSEEIKGISERVLKLLMESDKRKAEHEKLKQEEDIEDEEKEVIEED
jgi:hypothetical protein